MSVPISDYHLDSGRLLDQSTTEFWRRSMALKVQELFRNCLRILALCSLSFFLAWNRKTKSGGHLKYVRQGQWWSQANTTQREWEKIWHNQTLHNYLRSLDHQGIHVKAADKKTFASKALIDAIKAKHEEQRRQRSIYAKVDRHQFAHLFDDEDVITDVLRIMVLYVSNANQHNVNERRRISDFFEKFISYFFNIPMSQIIDSTKDVERVSVEDE